MPFGHVSSCRAPSNPEMQLMSIHTEKCMTVKITFNQSCYKPENEFLQVMYRISLIAQQSHVLLSGRKSYPLLKIIWKMTFRFSFILLNYISLFAAFLSDFLSFITFSSLKNLQRQTRKQKAWITMLWNNGWFIAHNLFSQMKYLSVYSDWSCFCVHFFFCL